MPRKKVGRPTKYNQKLADTICFELSQGKSLRTVCKMDGIPDGATIFAWFRLYPEFLKQYTRAKQEAADAMAEDVQDIADDSQDDWTTRINSKGEEYEVVNKEAVARSKLRVETRKWLMAKMKPKKYGDSLDIKSDGEKIQVAPIYSGGSLNVESTSDVTADPD